MAKFCYADPPYIGCSKYYAEGEEVDHVALIWKLQDEYAGWALSGTSSSLPFLMSIAPKGARVGVWVKPAYKPFLQTGRVAWAWEPVVFKPIRGRAKTQRVIPDWIVTSPPPGRNTNQGFITGVKPDAFCFWIFEILGARMDDDFHDMFPGSGAVTHAWWSWAAAERMVRASGNGYMPKGTPSALTRALTKRRPGRPPV